VAPFDLSGVLRRVRRLADLSQRELAAAIGWSKSGVAGAECGTSGMDARLLARAAALADLRLVLVDADGRQVGGMSDEAVRDQRGRRFPAHLDTRYGDQAWWHGSERYSREQPWYTFDRRRHERDRFRDGAPIPDDHQRPEPGDSPAERAAARRDEAQERRRYRAERLRIAGLLPPVADVECTCPPGCDELEEKPFHAEDCPCRCDVD
jgi:transcriptional regulator with XRE-family HTH domain